MPDKLKQSDLRVGDFVRYLPSHYTKSLCEYGRVKEIPEHTSDAVRVVYNCANDWSNYVNYTSAMTRLEDLRLGWAGKELPPINTEDIDLAPREFHKELVTLPLNELITITFADGSQFKARYTMTCHDSICLLMTKRVKKVEK